MVITGLTRNQFVRKHTRVRIPLSPPTPSTPLGVLFALAERGSIMNAFCFASKAKEGAHLSRKLSGRSLTSGSAKNSRVGEYPSLLYSKKGLRFLLFCDIILINLLSFKRGV